MAHDETIRIYRSNVPGAEPPSLTYGELAANLADRKVFVGGPGGTADMIVLLETPDSGVTGISAGHTGIALSGTTGNVQIFNMGVLSLDGQTGHLSRGATGDTISAGLAIGVSVVSGNNKRIDNLGVTSFNGLTGAVRYAPPLATNGASGVASFLSRDFSVSNTGHVSLSNNFIEIDSGNGISVFPEGRVDLGQAVTIRNIGVTSFNGSTGSISLIDFVQGAGIATIATGNKVTFANIGVTSFNGQTGSVVYHPPIASEGASGVASFDDSNFRVTSTGHVYIKTGGVGKTELEDSDITINTNPGSGLVGGGTVSLGSSLTLTNIGVTGISAGHTGIALNGTTGNVQIFNMGVLSIDGKTGHYITPALGATGDTITAGLAIGVSVVSGNQKRIDNLGVTSFNGKTGAVQYSPPLATNGESGVASFLSTHFAVSSTGHVSLQPIKLGEGDIADFDTGSIDDGLVITYNPVHDPSQPYYMESIGNLYSPRVVSGSLTGVASFNSTHFSVSSSTGHVSLANAYTITGNTVVAGSGIAIPASLDNSRTIINIGVTGISAGHTGISLVGTTGNVRIFNMGVHTFNGATGHITFNPTTGDTITAGLAIGVSVVSGNNKRIDNLGVTSFNGLTGAVTLTGDGGAVVGVGNNTIRARLATESLTGVAAFPATFFAVNNGAVSLSGPYAVIGVTGISAGHTGISLIGTTGNVRIFNMGVHTFNGATGHITFNPATGDTITAGLAIGVSVVSGNNKRIDNLGVTSFNGATGAVSLTGDGGAIVGVSNNTITARLATSGATGVASFPATFFSVSNGAVSLSGPYAIIGVTGVSAGHTGISLVGTTGNVQIFNMGVLSLDGQTGHLTRGSTGDTITAGLAIGVSPVSGNNKRIDNLGVTSFNGATGAILYAPPLATIGASGVASFLAQDFSVSNTGHVSLSSRSVTINTGSGLVGGGAVNLGGSLTFANIGVTGISAGHTGIALSGTTGNVQIWNMGVHTFNGSTGHITFNPVTGDTITAGLAIGVSVVSGNNKRIDNLGVTSFNGATGAVRYAPPLATLGVSGVASFDSGDFAVSGTGHVTIKPLGVGNAQLENSTFRVYTNNGSGLAGGAQVALGGDITLTNIGVTGISAGHTGISLIGTTGNVRIFNMGVHTFNGATGHITFNPATGNTVLAGSGIAIPPSGAGDNTRTIINVGVTGIGFGANDAGLTGKVNLTAGTSITLDYNSTTKTITINSTGVVGATGDTVVAGVGISAVRTNNEVRINNMGVTSFNGLTGAVTLTGDSGAIIGRGNSTITARLATASLTGVASFPTADFGVVNGVVSLTGNVPRTNQLNTFSVSQNFSGGFVVGAGATFTSTISSIGNISTTQNISAQGTVLGSNILRWESVTANRSLSANYGVFANKPVASGQLGLTMGSSSATVGAAIRVTGITGSWRIVLDDNHLVYFGNTRAETTITEYAYMESTHHRDSIEMVCFNAGQGSKYEWNVLSSVGSINLGTISRLGLG